MFLKSFGNFLLFRYVYPKGLITWKIQSFQSTYRWLCCQWMGNHRISWSRLKQCPYGFTSTWNVGREIMGYTEQHPTLYRNYIQDFFGNTHWNYTQPYTGTTPNHKYELHSPLIWNYNLENHPITLWNDT